MAATDFLVANVDMDDYGFTVTNLPDWRAAPSRRWQTGQTATRPHRQLLANEPVYDRRTLRVDGYFAAASEATLLSNIDKAKSVCDSKNEVTIEFGDQTSKWYYGRFTGMVLGRNDSGREFKASGAAFQRATFLFDLPDPFLYDDAVTTVTNIQSTLTAIATGNVLSFRDCVFTITGTAGASNPVITYADSGSTTVKTLSLTANVTAAQTRVIDMEAGTIVNQSSSNAIAERDSGTDFPFAPDPRDGVFRTSAWPQVKITSTGAQMKLAVQIRKAYL